MSKYINLTLKISIIIPAISIPCLYLCGYLYELGYLDEYVVPSSFYSLFSKTFHETLRMAFFLAITLFTLYSKKITFIMYAVLLTGLVIIFATTYIDYLIAKSKPLKINKEIFN